MQYQTKVMIGLVIILSAITAVAETGEDANRPLQENLDQEEIPREQASPGVLPARGNYLFNVSVNSSYTGAGDAKFRGSKPGDSEAYALSVSVNSRITVSDRWFVPLGLSSENFFLEAVSGVPIPKQINTLRLSTGVGFRPNDKLTITGTLSPVLYNLQEIDSNDLGLSGALLATYRYRPHLSISAGFLISPDSDIVVFPVGGFTWDINQNYTLDLMMPRPRLIYHLSPKVDLYVGGEMKAATFRARNRTHMPEFNEAIASYRDFRLGAGTEYQLNNNLGVEVDAGYSVYRYIDYRRIDEKVKFEPAPYVRAGLRYRF